jgi:hypothetical protein
MAVRDCSSSPALVGTVFAPLFAPGVVDENLLDRGGSGLEKMPAIGEVLLTIPGNLEPGLVHQRRRPQRLAGFLISHADKGELAQLVIDQRKQLIGSGRIAGLSTLEDAGHIAHGPSVCFSSRKYSPKKTPQPVGQKPALSGLDIVAVLLKLAVCSRTQPPGSRSYGTTANGLAGLINL